MSDIVYCEAKEERRSRMLNQYLPRHICWIEIDAK